MVKVDILKHSLVPEYRVLSKEEVGELLKKFGVRKRNLPKMLSTDPVAKVLGLKVGDVVEITRKSLVTGEGKYYRVVVNAP